MRVIHNEENITFFFSLPLSPPPVQQRPAVVSRTIVIYTHITCDYYYHKRYSCVYRARNVTIGHSKIKNIPARALINTINSVDRENCPNVDSVR